MTQSRIGTIGRETAEAIGPKAGLAALLVAMTTALMVGSSPACAASPFSGFAGTWKGGGSISMTDGSREAIRCKLRSGGEALAINVLCASDSYRVHILSNIAVQGETFSGSWQETTRQISGDLTGDIPQPNTYQASLQTMGGGLELGARTNGTEQAITITSQGSDIAGASILLRKR